MNTEIEIKFVNIDHEAIRKRLTSLGATLEQPMRTMRRVTIDNDLMKSKNAFLRIRDEGHRTTVTYKQFDSLSIDGAKEIEITVSDFQSAIDLFNAAGIPHKSYQESKRETWKLDEVEIVLDEWPWLKPYIELEASSKEALQQAASLLGLDWEDGVYGDVMEAYKKQYPHLGPKDTVGNLDFVRFNDPVPEMFKTPN
jgi:adenylate cyclase class 2